MKLFKIIINFEDGSTTIEEKCYAPISYLGGFTNEKGDNHFDKLKEIQSIEIISN